MISFKEFFKFENPGSIKVKFNMSCGRGGERAWKNLLENKDDCLNDEWIKMNAHRKKQASNNLDKAQYLLSFAQYDPYGAHFYVFGGLYKVEKISPEIYDGVGYRLELMDAYKEYRKRLIIKLDKPIGRNLYTRWYDKVQEQLNPEIYALTPSTALGNFPGYTNFCISHYDLQTIYRNESPEWKQALSKVKGVYCITDKSTEKLYIGSASGNNANEKYKE